jgi:hypothetical protein
MNQLSEAAHAGAYRVLQDPPEYAIVDLVQETLERNNTLGHPLRKPSPNSAIGQAIICAYLAAEKYMDENDPNNELQEGSPEFNKHFETAVEEGAAAGLRYLTGRG